MKQRRLRAKALFGAKEKSRMKQRRFRGKAVQCTVYMEQYRKVQDCYRKIGKIVNLRASILFWLIVDTGGLEIF